MRKGVISVFGLLVCFLLCCYLTASRGFTTTWRMPILAHDAAPRPTGIAELPDGFSEKIVAAGITGATAMTVAPDGRVFVCEQTGTLRVVKDDRLLKEPFVRVRVDSSWERGLIGVALDPNFPKKPYVYLCYVAPLPYPHHRVSRFTAQGDMAVPDREVILLKGDDQTKLGGGVPNGHQGGALHFGKDGKLYVAIGEQTAGLPAQRLDTFQGKLLRINPDGSIPPDNPFFKTATGKYRAIWALGLRNPFTFAVQPGSGRIFINDVGEARWEMIDEGVAGANYGWPHTEGPGTNPKFHKPLYAYDHGVGRSIAGGMFYNPPVGQFPKEFLGRYFFADFMDNWIRVLDPDNPRDVRLFATGLAGPVDLRVAPDGSLYYLNRNAWVKDDKFKPNTGSLRRISYSANAGGAAPLFTVQPEEVTAGVGRRTTFRVTAKGQEPLHHQWYRNGQAVSGADGPALAVTVTPADDGAEFRCLVWNAHGAIKSRPAALWTTPLPRQLEALRVGLNPRDLPRLLSETGVFRSLKDLTPTTGVLPYDVNSPLWSDGAVKRRWIALPSETRIGFSEHGAWRFPPGTVFVKHFEMPAGNGLPARRLETRLLVVDRRGSGYGVTYKWRVDGSDAELLADGLTETIARGERKQTWSYPGRNDCLVCHTKNAGFVLGVNTRQLNHSLTDSDAKETGNMLQAWNRLGLFQPAIPDKDIGRLDRLVAATDAAATLEHRVRSYLDVNCAQCHRPGGTRGDFDARYDTPLARQKLVNAPLLSSDLGVPGVKLVAPGDPERSMVYLRMKRRQDVFNMPPLASHDIDIVAVTVMRDWIKALRHDRPVPRRLSGKPKTVATGFQPVELKRENATGWKPVATAGKPKTVKTGFQPVELKRENATGWKPVATAGEPFRTALKPSVSPKAADKPRVIPLWPGKAPDEPREIGPEKVYMSRKLTRKEVEVTQPTRLVTNVSHPTLTIYRPEKDKDTRAAVLICPGGGYWDLYWELEGEEVAAWLNSHGVTGIILKYRVPRRPDEIKGEPARRPLQDAQRAVSLVRSKALAWGIDPKRIGMIGFSAGGHLAIATATSFEKRTYAPIDDIDKVSCQPDFAIAAYSGYLKAKDKNELAPGLHVPAGTPPIFLVHGGADIISPPEHSVVMYLALKRAGIPAELHIYDGAAHDFAVRKVDHLCATWTERCIDWMKSQGFLKPARAGRGG